ncbi:MAG: 5'/3'-nucleotidase SurE [Bacteroidaceae bacterium]|nr:5'/3'-nucleotidase SurE [Bacteroidaceae bacterium]
MKKKCPLILISNDDGIAAKGLRVLIDILRPLGDLVVMAPDSQRSGSSCSLTVTVPIHYRLVHREEGLTIYECSGTPTECIKLARYTVTDRLPDLVVGGINHGDNSATNVHYSGTMGVVIEGCINGIPSIAYSLCSHDPDANFEVLCSYIRKITSMILKSGLPPLVCLNVNFPDIKEFNGVRVCEQAKGIWTKEWESCQRGVDANYFWLSGSFTDKEPDNEKSDHWALEHGYVAITPTTVDVTAYGFIDELSQKCKQIDF